MERDSAGLSSALFKLRLIFFFELDKRKETGKLVFLGLDFGCDECDIQMCKCKCI